MVFGSTAGFLPLVEYADTVNCNLNPPIRGSAVGQNHHQEPDLPNLMAKPVDKARRIRYNFYGILCIWSYLIIPWIAGSSESVFCFWT